MLSLYTSLSACTPESEKTILQCNNKPKRERIYLNLYSGMDQNAVMDSLNSLSRDKVVNHNNKVFYIININSNDHLIFLLIPEYHKTCGLKGIYFNFLARKERNTITQTDLDFYIKNRYTNPLNTTRPSISSSTAKSFLIYLTSTLGTPIIKKQLYKSYSWNQKGNHYSLYISKRKENQKAFDDAGIKLMKDSDDTNTICCPEDITGVNFIITNKSFEEREKAEQDSIESQAKAKDINDVKVSKEDF
jgi:hypothetical protein